MAFEAPNPKLDPKKGASPSDLEQARKDAVQTNRKMNEVQARYQALRKGETPVAADKSEAARARAKKNMNAAFGEQAKKDKDQIAAVKKDLGVPDSRAKKEGESTEAYRQRLAREQLETKYGAPKRPSAVAGMQAGEVMSARKRPGEKIEPVESMQDKVDKLMAEYNNLRANMGKLEGKGFALFKKARLNRMRQMETNLNQQVFQLTQGMEDKRDARAIYDSGAGYDARIRKEIRSDLEQRTSDYKNQIAGRVEARRDAEAEKALGEAAASREEEMAAYRPITDVEKSVAEKQPDVTEELKLVEEKPDVTADLEEQRPTQEELRTAAEITEKRVEDMGEVEAMEDEPSDEEIEAQMAEVNAQLAEDEAREKAERMAKYPKAIRLDKEGRLPENYAAKKDENLEVLELDDEDVPEIELDEDEDKKAKSA